MKPKPIASYRHFERLLKQFRKISLRQIGNNKYLKDEEFKIIYKFFSNQIPPYDIISNILLNNFKQNKYKTHSSIDDVMFSKYINRIWLSYTVEDENGIRYKGKDFRNKYLVFKIHFKFARYKKKRITIWRIPITWL